ncbi:single-stranded-DNA-specific exonuclease RecJ [Niallia circulans]|uniref:Single-stranded-DNA-specific exonuclease RecJ n=1 Tax=Niallia circulans TaxID=1397 RepID=A0AA91TW45_NIACI|nr:DHH family phosphoesterase [Niallia circulans]PAD84934.1 single-stranded-DNA-specific exonuclease RecJ [Niallia circulans]
MKYNLIGKNNTFDPLKQILYNRGIEDIDSYLKISKDVVIHWSKLKNIKSAIDVLLHHLNKKHKIFIQIDSDPDGYTSSALLINYIKNIYPDANIVWRVHEGKEHGVIVETVPEDVSLVILPDSGSNQIDEHRYLKNKGVDVIVLDHHECHCDSPYAIVVNSQLSNDYSNKQFSGVGITYKFCTGIDDILKVNFADQYLDLVAIGNIADSQDMRSLETRYFVNSGLKKIRNKMLNALYEKQSYSTKGVINITSTSFYINPLINACIRVGSNEEKEQMFRSFLEVEEEIYYKRKGVYEPIEVNTARTLGNLKAKQDRLRNKGIEEISERIREKNLLDNKILIVNITDLLHKNLTGVVANKLAEKHKRPTVLLRLDEENKFKGSIRGYDKSPIKDFKKLLQSVDKFDFVEGHPNAAGCQIAPENLIDANNIINKLLEDVDFNSDLHEVDFILNVKQLTKSLIKEIDKHKHLWGQNVDEPLIAVQEVEVNKEDIYLNGKTSKTLKFRVNDIEFIKFFSNEDEYNNIVSQGDRLVLDVIGKASVNVWENKETPQIVIEEYEIISGKKKQLLF